MEAKKVNVRCVFTAAEAAQNKLTRAASAIHPFIWEKTSDQDVGMSGKKKELRTEGSISTDCC